MRNRITRAAAGEIAAGLAQTLEALRSSASLAALELEVAALGPWRLRVTSLAGAQPVVMVDKDEGATAS